MAPGSLPRSHDSVPIIFTHVRSMRGIVASLYHPTPTLDVEDLARPLGFLATRYLTSHGYGRAEVETILQAYRRFGADSETFIMELAKGGMAVTEARFLFLLMGR